MTKREVIKQLELATVDHRLGWRVSNECFMRGGTFKIFWWENKNSPFISFALAIVIRRLVWESDPPWSLKWFRRV